MVKLGNSLGLAGPFYNNQDRYRFLRGINPHADLVLTVLGPQAHMSRYPESGSVEVSGNIDAQQVYAHLGVRRVHAYTAT